MLIRTATSRRRFLHGLTLSAACYSRPGLLAELLEERLILTPAQTEGPFYPKPLPLDTDNNLLTINDTLTPAVGRLTHLTGRVLTAAGAPVRNAEVEIWQCDNNGAYIHPGTGNKDKRDANFQGFGRFLTDATGAYHFLTIQPVPYPGRTPHIHFKIKKAGQPPLTTQCYIKGHPQNERDGVLRGIRDPKQRESVMVDFLPVKDSALGELRAHWEIVLGWTPEAAK